MDDAGWRVVHSAYDGLCSSLVGNRKKGTVTEEGPIMY